MKTTSKLLILAALAAPATAQTNSEPRTPRQLPLMSSEKLPAPAVEKGPAPECPPGSMPAEALAGAPAKPFDSSTRSEIAAAPIDRLYYTTQQDGTIWVSGRAYKAGFGSSGATYVPFFGSRAPHNFPVDMSLESATVDGHTIALEPAFAAVRDGDRITIDRGPIDEVYELSLESVEQTFVVTERPASGDLKLFVRLQSELAPAATAEGFTFANEFGSVLYSHAFVREADGTRLPVSAQLREGGVEIQVDASTMASASFPLVVDPVITTFSVDNSAYDSVEADISYDLTTDRYLIVYERVYSANDGDIYAILREGNGSNSYFAYLDNTVENWRSPQCANLNAANQFLMVAQVSNVTGAPNWNIWGMTVEATTMVPGWKTLISTTDQFGPKVLGEVGGDPYDGPGGAYYCVVWRRDYAAGDTDIHARLVTSSSTLVGPGTILIDNSGATLDEWPSVSKSDGMLGGAAAWTIAWHRGYSGSSVDIHAARLAWDGTILNGSATIYSTGSVDYYPRVSSPLDDGRTLVIYAHLWPTNHDLLYSLLSGTTVVASGNLTALEGSGFQNQNQLEYSLDSDGQRFAVIYSENYGSSTFDYDIWVSSFVPYGSSIFPVEVHASLDFSVQQSFRTDVVATHSGGGAARRFCAVWDSTSYTNQHDILGGIYEAPLGGGYQPFCPGDGLLFGCPCGNDGALRRGCGNSVNSSGASLSGTGSSQTGSGDDLTLAVDGVPPNVTCTLFQGTNGLTVPNVFGDGLRCVTGSLVRIRTKSADSSGNAAWPTGSEADISVTGHVPAAGGQRYYQVNYRNSASFCTAATFNISNGMRVLWLP